jgi:hypothetical protein
MSMRHLPAARAMRARAASLGLAALMLLAGATAAVAPAAAAVPDPVVTGPIPANVAPGNPARDYPWMATMHNLAAVGYTEEEFFYEGTANSYDTSGALGTTGSVVSSGHPYKTRMVVRRPLSPAQFNGTVIVEWQNVTAGYDLDANWGGSFEHFIRSGYAWVGVSAQRVGVQGAPNGLKAWSPLRYGQLDVTAGGTITNDALSYDIFAQAMQAIRHPVGVNVMGGLNVQRVLAIGASQSASRLAIYINSLHPLIGDPVDAYMLYIGGGRIRGDLTVPVFKLISETDVPGQVASRQPDSAVFRSWEVAGSSHSGRRTALNSRPLALRDGVAPAEGVCDFPVHPRVPSHYVANAVYDHLVRWVRDKTPPPSAAPVTTVGNTIQRDSFGNALGGVRLAEFAVPTAENTGDNAGSAFCVSMAATCPSIPRPSTACIPRMHAIRGRWPHSRRPTCKPATSLRKTPRAPTSWPRNRSSAPRHPAGPCAARRKTCWSKASTTSTRLKAVTSSRTRCSASSRASPRRTAPAARRRPRRMRPRGARCNATSTA